VVLVLDVIIDRVCGVDIGKAVLAATVRTPAEGTARKRREETRKFPTFVGDLDRLAQWLTAEGVTVVAMEATSDYWRPVWWVLEQAGFELVLVNARDVHQLPGRKTDVADSAWLAQLLECGLLRSSFVPPPEIRELRDLTRYRKRLVQDRTREAQRVEKVLEDSGIKLSSVASSVLTKSARAMIDALIAGERDPKVLAELAQGRMRSKMDELILALRGRFTDHHALLLGVHLDHIDQIDAHIATIDARVEAKTAPFDRQLAHLVTMPGIAEVAARVVIAEIGVDMSIFPTAGHLASWAGLCPGNNESAGKHRSGHTTHGNPWLAETLVQAAWAATRHKDSWLRARYYRLTKRIGRKRAIVAIAHSMLIAIWWMLTEDCDYQDLGGDFYDRFNNTEAETRRLVRRLEHLGHHVALDTTAA
jgi:transposase